MINMQRGEASHSFLAGISAHNGDGVLSSGFQRHSRLVPPVLKGERGELQNFSHEFLLKANTLDISGQFVGQGTRVVPVGDPLKQRAVLLREGFSSGEIKGAYQAWNVMDGALQSEAERSILKRFKSPRDVLTTLRSGTIQRGRLRLKRYMASSMISPFSPTATPSRHFMP